MPIVVVGAASVSLSFVVLWWAVAGDRVAAAVTRNLHVGRTASSDMREALLAHNARERAVQPAVERLARFARRATPAGMIEGVERRILLAGAPERWTTDRVLGVKVALGMSAAAFGTLRIVASPGTGTFRFAAVITALGFFGPDILLYNTAVKRQGAIRLAVADTLDQITICVEAGLGFEAAIARAGKTGEGPLAEELLRTIQDMQVGMSRHEAMKRLVARTDAAELRHFVLAVLQADAYGLPIAHVLRVQSKELRVKRRQRAEEQAMKLPVKIIFPLVLCIFPCMFIVLLGPAAIRIAETFEI
jgi:tight adherence protein C